MQALLHMIRKSHSRAQADAIIAWVGDDAKKFAALVDAFLNGEPMVQQRAGWPLSDIALSDPDLVKPHLADLIANLQRSHLHAAIKRHTMRLLQEADLPETLEGAVMDHCFRYLEDPKEAVAVKAHAMGVLRKLSVKYPDILPEIRQILQAQAGSFTPALKVRARPFLTNN